MAVGVGMGGGVIPPALYRPKADLFAPAPVPLFVAEKGGGLGGLLDLPVPVPRCASLRLDPSSLSRINVRTPKG